MRSVANLIRLLHRLVPRSLTTRLRLRVRRLREALRPPFDVFRHEVLSDLLRQCGVPPLTATAADAETDEPGAARYALARLLQDPALRHRFPRALSDGPEGGYCRWLCSSGLSAAGAANVRAVFAHPPGDRVHRLFDFRGDLLALFPFGLIAPAQRSYARWLLTRGKVDFEFSDEAVLWFLFASTEDACGAVVASYLRNPEWQRWFPDALAPSGRVRFLNWLRLWCRLSDEELKRFDPALRPTDEKPIETARIVPRKAAPGVNILAHFCHVSGTREAALGIDRDLRSARVSTSRRDLPARMETDLPIRERYLGMEVHDTTLLVAPVPFIASAYSLAGLAPRSGVYRIAVQYWELEWVPPEWRAHAEHLDEIWAPTRFIADALRPVMPVPVFEMPPGLAIGDVTPLPRGRFGVPDDHCLFLFLFDMSSGMERKNPLSLIRAFRRAFRPDDRACLVIKVVRGASNPKDWARLKSAADEAGVQLLDSVLSREETLGLVSACDCYVSLHRSEGLGLVLAEAMLQSKPVIATGYSGNLQFMTRNNSLLIGYERTEIRVDASPTYPGGRIWAEPSVEEAAHRMRWVYEYRDEALALGARGRVEVARALSPEASGQRMRRRLEEIRNSVTKSSGRKSKRRLK